MATSAQLQAELDGAIQNRPITQGYVSYWCSPEPDCKDNPSIGDCLTGCPPKCKDSSGKPIPKDASVCTTQTTELNKQNNIINTYPDLIIAAKKEEEKNKRKLTWSKIWPWLLGVVVIAGLVTLFFVGRRKGWFSKKSLTPST